MYIVQLSSVCYETVELSKVEKEEGGCRRGEYTR